MQPSSREMNRPGPATPQQRSSTETPGCDAGSLRERTDLARSHEALLLDVLARRVSGLTGPPQGAVERDPKSGMHSSSVRMFAYGGTLRAGQGAPLIGLAGQSTLLMVLAATVGLGGAGWLIGASCGMVVNVALARGVTYHRAKRLGPAVWVTLARATLVVGVAALAADSFVRPASLATLVTLAAVALALDWVDGQVARRTATESKLGAQLDGEVDAFLILALSVAVAPSAGVWVLAIGTARYAFLAAGVAARSGCARRCRGATGARRSRRCRASCSRSPSADVLPRDRDPRRPRRRARPAGRVVRPRRVVAVAPPARSRRS